MTHLPTRSPRIPVCLLLTIGLALPARGSVQEGRVDGMAHPDAPGDAGGASCFTMQAPGEGWRQLHLVELRNLDPEAQVGLAGPFGVRSILFAEISRRVDLAACARQLLEDQHLDQVKYVFEEATRVEGREAAHALVTGRRDGIWWRYHATAFREGRELYLLLSWGRSDEVPADGSTLLQATLGLERVAGVGLEELRRAGSALDADGPGWRVRAGCYRDAALGFELTPRGAWRVATQRELERLGPDVHAGLIDELHDAVLGIVAERVPPANQNGYSDACRRRALAQGHQAGTRSERIADREIEFKRITLPGPTGYGDQTVRALFGIFFEGDRCFQVRASFAASLEQAMGRSLPQALASLRLLSEPERASLAEELAREAVPGEAVGEGWCLRNGVFTDFRNGFRWQVPEGFWELRAAEQDSARRSGPALEMYERQLGVRGWIRADEGEAFLGAEGHTLALEQLASERALGELQEPRRVRLGALEGLLSSCALEDPDQPLRALLASAGDDRRGFRICFTAPPQTLQHHADAVAAAISALHIDAQYLTPTILDAGRYVDARMGFELASPDPRWLFSERKLERFGARAESALGVLVAFEGDGGAGLYASAAWMPGGPGDLDQSLTALVPAALQSALSLPDAPPGGDQVATLRGRPCRLLTWQDGERRIELVIIVHASSAYAVAVVGNDSGSAPRDWLAGFRLLD